MTSITLSDVGKQFGDLQAVADADIEIGDGEFVSIVGPSGCGKTTTLRVIAGLEEATSGRIRFGDDDVTTVPAANRNVGMVFQNLALYPHMTVRENMAFGLRIADVSEPERQSRIEEAAAMLDIEDLLDRDPGELSGGQRQRVAIGRTIVLDPSVFLLDEPLASLDAKLRVEIREELQELHQRIGVTTVYVTHDQEQAMTMSDRIVVMRDGEVQQFATPNEVYENPINEFVANFIGTPSMNFFDGELTRGRDALIADCGVVQLPVSGSTAATPGTEIRLGIRPEHVSLVDPGEGAFRTTVNFVEPTGRDSIVHLETDETELKAVVDGGRAVTAGEHYDVAAPADRRYLFDAETGSRLD